MSTSTKYRCVKTKSGSGVSGGDSESYLAKTRHGVPIHLLTLAITLQAHGSVGEFTHLPKRDRDACIIDLSWYAR